MVQQTLLPLVRGEWMPMTSEEFDAWVPEGMQAEWVDGKGIIFVSTSIWHGELVDFFTELLRGFVRILDLGRVFSAPIELRLPPHGERREPAVFVVLKSELDRVHRLWVEGPVGFATEFLSEHTAREDRNAKKRAYATAGIREYPLIDAREGQDGFEFNRLNAAGHYDLVEPDAEGRYHSEVLPGFWIDPRWFRQDPLPSVSALLREIAPEAYEAWLLDEIRALRRREQ